MIKSPDNLPDVRNILAETQLAIHRNVMHSIFPILLNQQRCTFLIFLGVFPSPPIVELAILIVFSSTVIKSM
jgi:hypothetical protein